MGTIVSVVSSNVPYAVATQNPDENACSHSGLNPGGNPQGNPHCLVTPDGYNQPDRNCRSPNADKDNHGDGETFCRLSSN